jgi:hypothetical protein
MLELDHFEHGSYAAFGHSKLATSGEPLKFAIFDTGK